MSQHHKAWNFIGTIVLSGVLFLGLFLPSLHVDAASIPAKVLVVLSTEDQQINEHQRLLDMLLSHFTSDISFKSTSEVRAEDLSSVTHLFYFGQTNEELPHSFLRMLEAYKGSFMVIGHNVDQLKERYSFLQTDNTEVVTEELFLKKENKRIVVDPHTILKVNALEGAEVKIEARHGTQAYPLFVQKGNSYYYATNNLFPPTSNFLAEVLHDVFALDHAAPSQAYLRLEDVHPATDPEELMKIAEELKRRHIPYMVSVIPVYIDLETEEEYHLSDAPEFRAVLTYMQENGGSLILHGYTDQYYQGRTGDGFEFWNAEENMPIYTDPGKGQKNFDVGKYSEEGKAFEAEYIRGRLQKGMEELVEYGLYPLAFEAPHYAMSQNGYEVISEHFSTYVGQIQLTDKDWRKMTESPYITSPSFFHGMTLLPETIRYVRYNDPVSVQEMKQRINDFTVVRDGVIGGFYHPFLGVRGLNEILNELEKIPNLQWINLKDMENTVRFEGIKISSSNGDLHTDVVHKSLLDATSGPFPLQYLLSLSKDNAYWVAIGAGLTAVMTVFSYILLRRIRRARL